MSQLNGQLPITVSLIGVEDCNPKRDPHFKVSIHPFGPKPGVLLEQVMCGGPVGEVLTVEQAESLRNALNVAIDAARASAADEPLIIIDKNGPDFAPLAAEQPQGAA
jgi:hypothetical protein